jgi:phosphohistidine swiveling domain-containing protein
VSEPAAPSSAWIGDSTIGERFPAWTRGNAADVFPEPFSVLGRDLVLLQGMSRGLRDAYISFGALDWEEFEHPELPDLFMRFGGYPYNPLSLTRILGARMPGVTPELIDQAFFDEGADIPPYEAEPWHESEKHAEALGAAVGWALSVQSFPFLDDDKALAETLRETRPDLAKLEDAAVLARAKSMVAYVQLAFDNAMRVSSLSSVGTGILGAITTALGDPTMAVRLLAGIEVDSGAPSHAMWQLGRLARKSPTVTAMFEAGTDDLVDRLRASSDPGAVEFRNHLDIFFRHFGSRGPNEYDPISLSWELAPRIALAAIDLMRKSDDSAAPVARQRASVAERDRLVAQIREQLAGDAETLGTFEAGLHSAQLFLAGRERAKTTVVRIINEMRVALHELGRRWVERGLIETPQQVFMLTADEIDHLRHDPEQFRPVIAERWATFKHLGKYEPVFNVNHRVPELSEMTPREGHGVAQVGSGTVLTGTAGSAGVATGRARVVLDAADPEGLEPGDVLIAPQTDPSWVPLFVPAAAVVVNVGALGSHAMIVSRELGIPCVVAVADATKKIPDGATVTVDGNTGTVTVH